MKVYLRMMMVASLIIAPTAAQAGLILNVNSTWPATPAVQTSVGPTGAGTERGVDSGRNPMQTFQADADFQLDKIFLGYRGPLASQSFSIRLFTVPDVNIDPATSLLTPDDPGYSGAVLFTEPVTFPDSGLPASGTVTTLEFDLTDASEVMLTQSAGSAGYAFQILGDGDATHSFFWKLSSSGQGSIYAGGRFYEGPLATRSAFSGRDAALAVTAVPEQSSISLMLLSIAAIVWSKRRPPAKKMA